MNLTKFSVKETQQISQYHFEIIDFEIFILVFYVTDLVYFLSILTKIIFLIIWMTD